MSTAPTQNIPSDWWRDLMRRRLPVAPTMIVLASMIGLMAGYGAALFTHLIHGVSHWTVRPVLNWSNGEMPSLWVLMLVPTLGLLIVAWFTRMFAPEAQGHGVPEVIYAVARQDGKIRPRVALVKILASGFCIGTGGSVGREGPIVQIGSALGSAFGQMFKLGPRELKVLVACGAAAGISATFHAPLAGVIFAGEVILGNFAVASLTPIVIASVLADVVQVNIGEHGLAPAFRQLEYVYYGNVQQLLLFFALGLVCGLAAVSFTRCVYRTEDLAAKWVPTWWKRALMAGLLVGLVGVLYPSSPPSTSEATKKRVKEEGPPEPPVFGVGYPVVDHSLHLEAEEKQEAASDLPEKKSDKKVSLSRDSMWRELWWLLPLLFLKPLLTSITLAGGGSGGIFAPSLFIGATTGACFGLVANLIAPELSVHPGVYAVVGMGGVVAGTTHGTLSAILIVYEMTEDYQIILPIMMVAGLAGIVASIIDPESIYHKKLSRRGVHLTRAHDVAELEHILVRDLMVKKFPTVKRENTVKEIVAIAKQFPHLEMLPVVGEDGKLNGFIHPEELSRVLESDVFPELVNAEDLVIRYTTSASPNENLLEALSDFGSRDVDILPVEEGKGENRKLIGLLLRAHVMQRYRKELLGRGSG